MFPRLNAFLAASGEHGPGKVDKPSGAVPLPAIDPRHDVGGGLMVGVTGIEPVTPTMSRKSRTGKMLENQLLPTEGWREPWTNDARTNTVQRASYAQPLWREVPTAEQFQATRAE
ncbi:hypothetical protein ABGN05_27335 [Aquibium sp. LZ166]|uniref:Uncharacterized protein n=1 Tax=Aquibium pacificus TaxID=3153579 RepID=A0ABV3ST52_9HYPH